MSFLSNEIQQMHEKISALSLMIQAASEKIAQLSQYNEILGTETLQHLLNWQADLNLQIKEARNELEAYYQKIDEIRAMLLG
jgi:uncharacterized protein YpbB